MDESTEVDSGVVEMNDEVKVWEQVSDEIQNQVPFSFTFPVHFIRFIQVLSPISKVFSNKNHWSESLSRQNCHLFEIILQIIDVRKTVKTS